ncbi:MAG: hypothetical protein NZL89_07360, partial [Leptospiraceae bacterium]|nr:hypothetical protein [Leptospiraceae bacterium]
MPLDCTIARGLVCLVAFAFLNHQRLGAYLGKQHKNWFDVYGAFWFQISDASGLTLPSRFT